MVTVLDEYGIHGREERLRWRSFWRGMFVAERKVRKKLEARKKPGAAGAPDEDEE